MSTIFDKNLLPEFDSVRDDNEEILWLEKPKFAPYVISSLGLLLGAAIFVGFYFAFQQFGKSNGVPDVSFHWLFIALPIGFSLWAFLRKLFAYSNTRYAYTNKRIMIRSGFIGTDFKSIDYDKISDMEVTVSFVERAFNVGSIRFFSGRTETDDGTTKKLYDHWEAIPNPYEVFRKVKQVSVDIKTDYNYPNALRPETNPGYNTRYDREG